MSTTAARRAREVVDLARRVVAIELLTATSALRHRQAERPRCALGAGTSAALAAIEPVLGEGLETPADEIAALEDLIASGALVRAVAAAVGALPEVLA